MVENLEIRLSSVSFVDQEGEQVVHILFNSTNGQINISGYVVVESEAFFANSGSTEAIVELARTEIVELVNRIPRLNRQLL
ncbi:hypothetical protein [Jeotgalibacillus marinus]|uniref:Uncharacterized protein n=1 Tax=Jeotgalibacillus marinus TaxID=86667 RepID=A0ABV3Q9J7_9BACL